MNFDTFFTIGLDTSRALPASYEPSLVVASYIVAALAGFAFLRFTRRIIELGDSVVRFAWMLAGALTMGLGVWAMHFVAMQAYRLPIPVSYDPLVTSVSALPAIIGSAVALFVVARPVVTMARLLVAATFMGAGIGTMHYTGMAALRFDAFVSYDPLLFATSIVVAVALAFVALFSTLWTMKRREGSPMLVRETVGALFMGLAVSGMHYTAMTSAFCFSTSWGQSRLLALDPQVFAAATTTVAVLVLLMAIGGVIFDRRLSLEVDRRRQREQRLALIMDNVADGLIAIDENGTIESFSRSAERIFGYTAAEMVGSNITALMFLDDRKLHSDGLKRYLATGKPAFVGMGPRELRARHKSGAIIHVELVVSRAEEDGRIVFIGALRDITERNTIQAQLQQAQKMEAIGQLTGGIAHDFNNMLGIIIGNLDLLKESTEENRESAELVDAALESALRGAELNKRLLAFARRQTLQVEHIDPVRVVNGMTELLSRAIGERVVVRMEHETAVWPVLADAAQLESAIVNLAVNARDAMPDGGTLTVGTANVDIDSDYVASHPGVVPGSYVCISVSDTGCGMSPDVVARAFEPFFTTKPVGKGSGLGLSMVFGFVRQSNGHVNIYSEPGRGTVVKMYLPRADAQVGSAAESPVPDDAPVVVARANETVLVVEDNEAMGEIAVRQLQELGYRVIRTRNGSEALQVMDEGTHIDILFTDVVMPGALDGINLTHEARKRRPALKVLLTSGFVHRSTDGTGQGDDVTLPARILTKPYRKHDLAATIRQVLDE